MNHARGKENRAVRAAGLPGETNRQPRGQGPAREAARTLGVCLRRIREDRDKSLRVVSGLAGMSRSTLHRIEHGRRDVTLSEIVALADALNFPAAKLVGLVMVEFSKPPR